MKDERVKFYRKALEALIDSLDATVRVTRWDTGDQVPEPLEQSAKSLVDRLGTTDRLVSSGFKGTPTDVARVNGMIGAMKRLDAAYVQYRQQVDARPGDKNVALSSLHEELDEVKADVARML